MGMTHPVRKATRRRRFPGAGATPVRGGWNGPSNRGRARAWGSAPPALDWMRRVRDAFDPGRTLSPGRYVT